MLKKIIKTLSITAIFSSFAFGMTGAGGTNIDTDKLKPPIQDIFKVVQWSLFEKEFQIYYKTKLCGKGLNLAIGFKSHMIEPVGFFETTKNRFFFPFAGIQLGHPNPIKAGNPKNESDDEGGRQAMVYAHFIYFPIMGMLLKNKIPAFCFSGGNFNVPFIAEFFPIWNRDFLYGNIVPQMTMMMTPDALVASIFSCVATEASASLRGYLAGHTNYNNFNGEAADAKSSNLDKTRTENATTGNNLAKRGIDYLNYIRNTMYFDLGCLGFTTIGGYTNGSDPFKSAQQLMYTTLTLLHGASTFLPNPVFFKQTNFTLSQAVKTPGGSYMGIKDTWCAPAKFPLAIQTQYVPQRVYPVVGDAHELGQSTVTTSNFANMPGSKDSVVYLVWERRDYAMFAYTCPGWGKNKQKK